MRGGGGNDGKKKAGKGRQYLGGSNEEDEDFTQSKILSNSKQGQACVDWKDKKQATKDNARLLYGEVSPSGVSKLLDVDHLNVFKKKI